MLRVELAVARAQAARGQIPPEALAALETKSRVDVDRIAEIERTTDHDIIAFVSQVAETVGPDGRYLHLGLTSSDVVDTGLALQLRAAGERLLLDLDRLLAVLVNRARAEATTVMMGRTHSVHAEPTTFGLKLAGWAFEVERGRVRLAAAVDEIGTGKISGPVGTYSHLEPDIEAEVLGALGLHVDPVSTQIVQRDRHAALLTAIAIVGGSLERFATEIRNLQHTEIGEVQEPFKAGQKGSSAMPHKRNPILSERIAGLARLLRGYAHTALEDQPLWHERDISHSSAERVILPDATILLDYMLVRMTGLVDGLLVRSERMRENIARGLGLHASSRVLLALVDDASMSREDAYAIVQRASLRAADEGASLRDLLAVDPVVAQRLSLSRLDACFDDAAVPAARARRHRAARPARPGRHPTAIHADGGPRWCWPLNRSCAPARCETCTRCRTDGSRSWPRDRISAFDVVLPTAIPDKGKVLTGLSRYWFGVTGGIVPNHLLGRRTRPFDDELRGRVDGLPADGRRAHRGGRPRLPRRIGLEGVPGERHGLRHRAPVRSPRERPPARADLHAGDQGRAGRARREHRLRDDGRASSAPSSPLGCGRTRSRCTSSRRPGPQRSGSCWPTRSSSSGSTARPESSCSSTRRITPDSSRFWDASTYEAGRPQASFDKQFVRDWLETQPWDKTAPGPELPVDVVDGTRARYIEAYERITGASFARYLEEDVIAS